MMVWCGGQGNSTEKKKKKKCVGAATVYVHAYIGSNKSLHI